ncbi:MAG: hypothetical protein HY820_41825 [Acidobacteria bacterium]|nr:hypothetical protein [Acidobacteriota bacterium]
MILSLPNVPNVTVGLALLFGCWEHTGRRILDNTHLRFFTRKSARRMIERASFTVKRQVMTVMPVELALGISVNPLMRAANLLPRAVAA